MSCHYFQTNYDSLHPAIDALIAASNAMLESKSLNGFLRFSLQTGNFINAVGYDINLIIYPCVPACVRAYVCACVRVCVCACVCECVSA